MTVNRDAETFQGARILADGETLTRAIGESEMEHISASESGSFTWHSSFATGGTNLECLTIENTENDKDLVIEKIFLGSTVTATNFDIGVKSGGTPAGTVVTPTCFNRENIKDGTARSSAFGNASVTGSVTIETMWLIPVAPAVNPFVLDTEGAWLLGKGDTLVIASSADATVSITVEGYFADPSQL